MKEVAAITGGSQGLGLACVERLVKDGYEVSVWIGPFERLSIFIGSVLWPK